MVRGEKNDKRLSCRLEVTLVSKGIQRSEYTSSVWIDERQKGRTSYFKVEKVGVKYVYGRYMYYEDNARKLCQWQAKIDPKDYQIYLGIHHDLKKAHADFLNKLEGYEKARKDRLRELERKAQNLVNARMKVWESEHPRPKNQF